MIKKVVSKTVTQTRRSRHTRDALEMQHKQTSKKQAGGHRIDLRRGKSRRSTHQHRPLRARVPGAVRRGERRGRVRDWSEAMSGGKTTLDLFGGQL